MSRNQPDPTRNHRTPPVKPGSAAGGVCPDFLDAVRCSKLVSVVELKKWVPTNGRHPPPASDVAARMVQQHVLTAFQAHHLLAGRYRNFVLQGKYRVLDMLGTGGGGSVFLCEHVGMKRRVAIKMIPPGRLTGESLQRFQREAAMSSLVYPNLVHALDCDHDGSLYFLVMEYVEGVDLLRLVAKRGPLDYGRAANYVAQAAAGLQYAFETGWIHRDVKPSNLLLNRAGRVRVTDMGVARLLQDVDDELTRQVEEQVGEQTILGSMDFMSPEQAYDSHDVDISTDVYGLGATLYFLVTGRSPLSPGTLPEKMLQLQRRSPPPPRSYRPGLPRDLEAVICRMMAKRPQARYETPAAAAAALRSCRCWAETVAPLDLPAGPEEHLYDFAPEKPASKVKIERPAAAPARQLPARRPRMKWVVGAILAGMALGALVFLAS